MFQLKLKNPQTEVGAVPNETKNLTLQYFKLTAYVDPDPDPQEHGSPDTTRYQRFEEWGR